MALSLTALTLGSVAPVGAAGLRSLSLSDLTFISPKLGWLRVAPVNAQTGALYRTADGGATWTLVSGHIGATSLVFRNKMDGEALVPVAGSAGMCQADLTAVATTDGGVLWQSPAAAHIQDAVSVLAFHGARPFLLNGACATSFATLMAPESGAKWGPVGEIGANATKNGFPAIVALTPSGSFATLVYLSGSASQAPTIRGFAYRVKGHAWHMVKIASTGLPGRVVAASFINGRDGTVATVNSAGTSVTLWLTQSGGQTWSKGLTVTGAGSQVGVDTVSQTVVYATVSGGHAALFRTTDAGHRWTQLPRPPK
jgi:hypothetical protein